MTVFFDFGCWEVSVFLILKGKKIQFDQQQKDTMRLLILLTILVVLATSTDRLNRLSGKSFTIAYNNLQIQTINGVQVSFTHQDINFHGCNHNWALYQSQSYMFQVLNGWSSTKIACEIDDDRQISQLFSLSRKLQFARQGRVNFYRGSTLLLTLDQVQDDLNRLAGRDFVIKSTIANVEKIIGTEVHFSDTTISFKGCNSNSASYSVKTGNRFQVTSFWMSTLLPCQKDTDPLIARLFSNSRYYAVLSNSGATFLGQNHEILIHLGPKAGNSPLSPFVGVNYVIAQTPLNTNAVIGINVNFGVKIISFKGCNQNSGAYTTTPPNKINVDQSWASTMMFCEVDFDSQVTKLFIDSKTYKICETTGSVTFFDQKSKQTLKLNVRRQIQPLALLKGVFKIKSNSARNEINGIQVLLIQGSISFGHCNTNTANYTAGGDNSFSITSTWSSTKKGCQPDYDPQIRSLFSNSVRYEPRDNGYAFFDIQSKELVQIEHLR